MSTLRTGYVSEVTKEFSNFSVKSWEKFKVNSQNLIFEDSKQNKMKWNEMILSVVNAIIAITNEAWSVVMKIG